MSTLNHIFVPWLGRIVGFRHRSTFKPIRRLKSATFVPPTTTLPVDSTGLATVSCPMDDNDTLGDCGEAMSAHADNIWTYGQGKPGFTESTFTDAALSAQYLKVSGGDNGLDEDEVVNQIIAPGIGVAGNPAAIVVDHQDFDVTDLALAQWLIDQFYLAYMAWSVPDAFIQNFTSGAIYMAAGRPNPANGHFTVLASVRSGTLSGQTVTGAYENETWGGYAICGPDFIESVEPECFAGFSPRQFSLATGLDSKGRHITAQASSWQAFTGRAIPASVISQFPPVSGPTPVPVPGPTPTPVPGPEPMPPAPPVTPSIFPYVTPALLAQYADEIITDLEKAFPQYVSIGTVLMWLLSLPLTTAALQHIADFINSLTGAQPPVTEPNSWDAAKRFAAAA